MAINNLAIPTAGAVSSFDFQSPLTALAQQYKQQQEQSVIKDTLARATNGGQIDPSALIGSGNLTLAQLGIQYQNKQQEQARQAALDARQRERDKVSDSQWSASHALQRAAAARASEDSFVVKEITDPNTGATTLVRVKTRGGQEGPISVTTPNPPEGAAPSGNPFGTGKFNEGQGKAAGFADRMLGAEAILSGRAPETGIGPTAPGVDAQGASVSGRYGSKIPVIGNFINSEDQQKFNQARDDFINAQLRRESGAAIGASEYANADRQYFPMPGDTPQVMEQKRRNRETAIKAMGREGGPSYRPENLLNEGGGVRSAKPKIAPAGQSLPRVTSEAGYNNLPSGAQFTAPDGSIRVKP